MPNNASCALHDIFLSPKWAKNGEFSHNVHPSSPQWSWIIFVLLYFKSQCAMIVHTLKSGIDTVPGNFFKSVVKMSCLHAQVTPVFSQGFVPWSRNSNKEDSLRHLKGVIHWCVRRRNTKKCSKGDWPSSLVYSEPAKYKIMSPQWQTTLQKDCFETNVPL